MGVLLNVRMSSQSRDIQDFISIKIDDVGSQGLVSTFGPSSYDLCAMIKGTGNQTSSEGCYSGQSIQNFENIMKNTFYFNRTMYIGGASFGMMLAGHCRAYLVHCWLVARRFL